MFCKGHTCHPSRRKVPKSGQRWFSAADAGPSLMRHRDSECQQMSQWWSSQFRWNFMYRNWAGSYSLLLDNGHLAEVNSQRSSCPTCIKMSIAGVQWLTVNLARVKTDEKKKVIETSVCVCMYGRHLECSSRMRSAQMRRDHQKPSSNSNTWVHQRVHSLLLWF